MPKRYVKHSLLSWQNGVYRDTKYQPNKGKRLWNKLRFDNVYNPLLTFWVVKVTAPAKQRMQITTQPESLSDVARIITVTLCNNFLTFAYYFFVNHKN